MKWLVPEQLTPADIFDLSSDNLLPPPFDYDFETMVGRINFLSCMYQTVLAPDSYFLGSPSLVKFLHNTDCNYLKDGIIAPVLREENWEDGKFKKIRKLKDLHKFFKEKMYDETLTHDPEKYLHAEFGDEINGIIDRINKYSRRPNSKIVTSPSSQNWNAVVAEDISHTQIVNRLGINKEWKDIVNSITKGYQGIIPSRGHIYRAAKNSPKQTEINAVADWIFYTNIWQAMDCHPTIDYPIHVQKINKFYEDSKLKPIRKTEKIITEVTKKVDGKLGMRNFSEVDYDDLLEARDYAKNWWEVIGRENLDAKEMWNTLEPLYGKMLHMSKPSSRQGGTKIVIKILEYAGKVSHIAHFALEMLRPADITHYTTVFGIEGLHYLAKVGFKKFKKRTYARLGRGGVSEIKGSFDNRLFN